MEDYSAEEVFGEGSVGQPARILVAEDSPDVRDLMKKALEKEGYVVDTVEDGSLAVNQFLSASYNLIILDFIMPQLNGIEVLKSIRATKSAEQLPVVMITSRRQDTLVREALVNGINDFFVKPLQPSLLKKRISNLLLSIEEKDINPILNSLNIPDPNALNPALNKKLGQLGLTAYPFTYREVKCCVILKSGKDPKSMASMPPERQRQEFIIYGKGGFLWNVVWPDQNSSNSVDCKKHLNVEEHLFEALK